MRLIKIVDLMKNFISNKQTVKLLLGKFLLIVFSIWSYIPIIIGILLPMAMILPIAYALWFLSSLLPGGLLFDAYIPITPGYPISTNQLMFIFTLEIIIFLAGIFMFLLGLYHLAKGKKQKALIVTTGIYNYIRHPQNLGISLIALTFALYVPGFNDIGIRIGEIFSWLLFTFILTIYSNLEEKHLIKKFPEEYSAYQYKTGFFFPKLNFRKEYFSKRTTFMTTQKSFVFLLLCYLISVILLFFVIESLVALKIITTVVYFKLSF